MSTITWISKKVEKLVRVYHTNDPYELCDALNISIKLKDLGEVIKAYYFSHSRIRKIVLNSNVSEPMQRILVAHELAHDRLHQKLAILGGFQEVAFFDISRPTEYEANIFASELLINDKELLGMLNFDEKSFFDIAQELDVPAPLLDFKLRILRDKGYHFEPLYIANGDFLKDNIDGYFVEEAWIGQ